MLLRLIFLILPLTIYAATDSIDQQIEDLKEERDRHRAQASIYQDEADRWQFENGDDDSDLSDARAAWDQADLENQKVQELQQQIDALEKKKQQMGGKSP